MSEFVLEPLSPEEEALAEWPEWLPAYFSYSQLSLANRCMEQYRLRYVKGERVAPSAALGWGRADHEAAELNFVQKIESHEDLPTEVVVDAFRDGFEGWIEDEGGMGEILWGEGKDARSEKVAIIDDGTRLVGLYHETLAPGVQPVAVEEEFSYQIPGIPLPVHGVLDLREPHRIIDRKTTGASKQKVTQEHVLQGGIYSAAFDLPTTIHMSVKPSRPAGKINVLESEPIVVTPVDQQVMKVEILRTLADIVASANRYGPDEPWKGARTHPWACGYCGFRDAGLCFYWGGAARG